MEDIIAVAVQLSSGKEVFFLTWGRIQDPVDPKPLAELVLKQSQRFSLGEPAISARVCGSLHEAADEPVFYEGFFTFCQQRIPYGNEYEAWRGEMQSLMEAGKELYFLGNPQRYSSPNQIPHATSTDSGSDSSTKQ